jgi:hypothetical protein
MEAGKRLEFVELLIPGALDAMWMTLMHVSDFFDEAACKREEYRRERYRLKLLERAINGCTNSCNPKKTSAE